ncbi:hypothetical protein F0562_023879 [Nyssa sinensis]|uniref:AP-3 complex subunit delta n=1 Tax=Nyssa sinensis TaxID=561372 RepID=A0A5J5BLN8_9ASTE|nr:hypothetical protein F0562_023879 [Nyssa sinensis]
MAGTSIMDSLFQRTLEDLIKGLRLQLVGESAFVSKALEEIRREIKSTDPHTKSTALQKLTYLNSLHGVDMSWAAFHAVEVTSSARFHHKKIGYLAGLAVVPLRHRRNPPHHQPAPQGPHRRQRVRAIATILKIFSKYPDAVRVCFKRLVENLESSDLQTASAAVGVFCELTAKDPKSYLPLAPEFYRILVDSRNNWVLIKVLKIFAKLAPLEPRLAKRIVEPICEHMRRTGAKSLIFECIWTIVTSLSEYESAMKLAAANIREFLVDDDPNLKYLGLQALLVVAPKHLWVVLENKEVVIKSLSDVDYNIKLEALRLVMAMVSEDNVAEICRVLVNYALKSDPEFCNEILGSILSTCCSNVYEIISDFDWYVSLLGEISRIPHCQKGEEIESQLIDIGMRVKDGRPELIRVGRDLLIDPALLGNPFLHRILSAAAWVSGEYVKFSKNPFELVEALLQPRTSLLPPSIRAVYIQSVLKVLTFCVHSYLLPIEAVASSSSCSVDLEPGVTDSVSGTECPESTDSPTCEALADSEQGEGFNPRALNQSIEDLSTENGADTIVTHGQISSSYSFKKDCFTPGSIASLFDLIETSLGPLSGSHEVEIQERVRNVLGLIGLIQGEIRGCLVPKEGNIEKKELKASEVITMMHDAFSEDLGPVPLSAQEKVPIPDGIVLKENLSDLEEVCGDIQFPTSSLFSLGRPHSGERDGVAPFKSQNKEESEPSTESTSLLAEHRKRHGLYYLPSEKKDIISNDYPPANDHKLQDNVNDDAEDLVKLTEQSFLTKKKPNQARPRPVVVKLDEGDEVPIAAKRPESRDDLISGAVRDVLLGNEVMPSSSRSNPSDKSSSKRRGKEKINIDQPSELKEDLANVVKSELGNPNSRRSKHRTRGKERKHRSPGKNGEEREENGQDKQKSSHRHARVTWNHHLGKAAENLNYKAPCNILFWTLRVASVGRAFNALELAYIYNISRKMKQIDESSYLQAWVCISRTSNAF